MFLKTEIKAATSDMMHEPMQANFPIHFDCPGHFGRIRILITRFLVA